MDDTAEVIRSTLDAVKTFLAQETPPRLSEADTKAYFVEPIIKALGWQGLEAVTREYYVRNSQEFIDYVLKGPNAKPLVAIETKALQVDLADKHAAQLVQYCAVDGIEWAVLANGRELQFFNAFLKGDLAAKRLLRLDLLAFNSADEFAGIYAQLLQLSCASMTAATGVRTWMHQRRMDALLRRQLTTPDSAPLTSLLESLAEADIPVTQQDLVRWFQVNLGTTVVFSGPSRGSEDTLTTPPTNESVLTRTPGSKPSEYATVTRGRRAAAGEGKLTLLVQAGVLYPGTKLALSKGGHVVLEAEVDGNGCLIAESKVYRSPSDRVFAHRLGRQSLNGWTEWRALLPEGPTTLAALRERLSTERQSGLA